MRMSYASFCADSTNFLVAASVYFFTLIFLGISIALNYLSFDPRELASDYFVFTRVSILM